MGTMRKPGAHNVYVMAGLLVKHGGYVPLEHDQSVAKHVQFCIDRGLLQRKTTSAWGEPWTEVETQGWIPTHEGWERIAEWSWDETGRKALGLRTREGRYAALAGRMNK